MKTYEFHEASIVFPLMDGAELRTLVEDIKSQGLIEPITLYDGKVLDGRNRLRACELAKVKPRFVEWDGGGSTPTEWVVSMNLHRRHLTTAQRAALALDLLPRLEEEAKDRQRLSQGRGVKGSPETDDLKGRSDEQAADLVGVGRSTVANAKAIQQRDETGEVVDAMRAGDLNVAQAARAVGFDRRGSGENVIENGDRDKAGKSKPVYYGKGDKFNDAILPASRYFRAWRTRDFRFSHVNYTEARKRLAILEELAADIEAARADLTQRSNPAKLRV